jgi:hypothetical protein
VQGFSTSRLCAWRRTRVGLSSLVQIWRRPLGLGALLLTIGSTATVVATTNTAPQFTSLTATPGILNEGQTITLNGAFTDPDAADAHGLLVYWIGGSANFKEKVELPPGQLSFHLTHRYVDDLAPTQIKVVLFDRQQPIHSNDNISGLGGSDTEHLPVVQVKNVAPSFVASSMVQTATAGGVVVEGDVTDPGSDRLKVGGTIRPNPINPNTDIPMACEMSGQSERHFRCQHTQQPNAGAKTYQIRLLAVDDDGGSRTLDLSVRFPGIFRP